MGVKWEKIKSRGPRKRNKAKKKRLGNVGFLLMVLVLIDILLMVK